MVFYFKIDGYYYRFIDLKQNIRISNYIMMNLKFMWIVPFFKANISCISLFPAYNTI